LDFYYIAGKDIEWNHLVQKRKNIWAILNTAINFRLPKNAIDF
jgi:hypothetical protein